MNHNLVVSSNFIGSNLVNCHGVTLTIVAIWLESESDYRRAHFMVLTYGRVTGGFQKIELPHPDWNMAPPPNPEDEHQI